MIICGTGHRPDKLGGYGPDVTNSLITVARDWLIAYTPELVISGGALGWDQALAWAAYYTKTPFTLALPFPRFECKWPKASQDNLENLVAHAHKVKYVCEEGYAPWKMQVRNKWMVDNSDQVLALWNGTDGGTANCIRYARSINKPIINIWEAYERIREQGQEQAV